MDEVARITESLGRWDGVVTLRQRREHCAGRRLGKPHTVLGRQRRLEGSTDACASSQLDLGDDGRYLDPTEHLLERFIA